MNCQPSFLSSRLARLVLVTSVITAMVSPSGLALISTGHAAVSPGQNQAATQKRVNKPSDDPLAATRVLQTKTEISSGQQFLKSVQQAKTFLEFSEQSIGELTEIINRAKELAISQANDPSSSQRLRGSPTGESCTRR